MAICKQYDNDKKLQEEVGYVDSYFEGLTKQINHTKNIDFS